MRGWAWGLGDGLVRLRLGMQGPERLLSWFRVRVGVTALKYVIRVGQITREPGWSLCV